ncbi:hypothetical protein [uncultured Chryseobacterium sp.]|uniref:hypothetical protein n=1 Tax=uncultured Chryseobacterium sp. TaxID=259322 RepID=UPI0025FEB352|nr:hypothetical protein [uncultured Chryseobacterium sp.]
MLLSGIAQSSTGVSVLNFVENARNQLKKGYADEPVTYGRKPGVHCGILVLKLIRNRG